MYGLRQLKTNSRLLSVLMLSAVICNYNSLSLPRNHTWFNHDFFLINILSNKKQTLLIVLRRKSFEIHEEKKGVLPLLSACKFWFHKYNASNPARNSTALIMFQIINLVFRNELISSISLTACFHTCYSLNFVLIHCTHFYFEHAVQ